MSRATYEPPGRVSPDRAVPGPATFPLELPRPLAPVVHRAWRGAFVRRLVAVDAVCALAAGAAALPMPGAPPTPLVALALPLVWIAALFGARSYDRNVLCEGPEEYRRVLVGAGLVLAGVALFSWAGQQEVSRSFVALSLPLATALTLAGRTAQRALLCRARTKGRYTQTTLLVGHRNGVAALDEQIDREAYHGYRVIGCCLPAVRHGRSAARRAAGARRPGRRRRRRPPLRGRHRRRPPRPELDGAALRRLGWELEKTHAELLLAPAVTEIAGPRVRIRPVCGLPLLHMERPELTGVRRLAKEVFDRAGAAALLCCSSLPSCSASPSSVKVDQPGPVFFRQERVGRDGRAFPMLKFRSMVVGADRDWSTSWPRRATATASCSR